MTVVIVFDVFLQFVTNPMIYGQDKREDREQGATQGATVWDGTECRYGLARMAGGTADVATIAAGAGAHGHLYRSARGI